MDLTGDEREDIRFALAQCAKLNREQAEQWFGPVRSKNDVARALDEQADRFEALARKITEATR